MKLEMHLHTSYSRDSFLRIENLAKQCRQKNIDGIAVCDHNTTEGALEFKKIAPAGFKLIIGQEIKTWQGEIIGYFLSKEIPSGLSVFETIKQIKEQGGLAAIPHPFDKIRRWSLFCHSDPARRGKNPAANNNSGKSTRSGVYPERSEGPAQDDIDIDINIDLIEIFNSRAVFDKYNHAALEFAKTYHIPGIVGSDAHTFYELGRSYIEIDDFDGAKDFLEKLKTAKFHCQKSSALVYLASAAAKIKNFPLL